jgi:hypothetical protein
MARDLGWLFALLVSGFVILGLLLAVIRLALWGFGLLL